MSIISRPSPGHRAPTQARRRLARSSGRVAALTAAVLAVGLAAGYGAHPSQPPPVRMVSANSDVTAAPSPELNPFYTQRLSWGPCEPFAVTPEAKTAFRDTTLDCAYLKVPLDYANPDGATAQIGVLRKKATDPTHRIGSLVTNPGGPGVSGMESVPGIAAGIGNGQVAQRFDLIGFDPRGVGASTPAIRCWTPAERDAARAALPVDLTTRAGTARYKAEIKDVAAKCADRTGRDVLAHVGTRDVVRDLDVLRAALGDTQLTYLGYSYGTSIGAAYAEAFPATVRALVLDGAIDPAQTGESRDTDQTAAFTRAFEAFAADCATRPDCPLGTDPKAASERFDTLVAPLTTHPARTRDGQRTLSARDAVTGRNNALYNPAKWALLRAGLTELGAGDGTTLLKLADDYHVRAEDGGYSRQDDAFQAIGCVDGITTCPFWPVPTTSRPHQPMVAGLPTVLIVSITGDPATPYKSGVNLANELHGRLLTAEGTQHTVALHGTTKCVDDAVTHYLVDLTSPAEGIRCAIADPSPGRR